MLLPYQRRWIADTSQLKIAEKSRRTGLTWAEAAEAALSGSISQEAGGTDTFYVGTTKDMAREFIDACAMWAKAYNLAASAIGEEALEDDDKDILVYVINFASGFKIKALSSNPSNLRGMQGNVIIDEAAFQKDLAAVLKAALALTMWGSNVRLISTHNGIENLFNTIITDSRAGKKRYSIHRIDIEMAISEGLYRRICQVTKKPWSPDAEAEWLANLLSDTATEEDAREEYYCEPKNGGGTYLARSIRERAARGSGLVLRFTGTAEFNAMPEIIRALDMQEWLDKVVLPVLNTLPQNLRHCLGEDFARSGHLTVFAPMTVNDDTTSSRSRRCSLSATGYRAATVSSWMAGGTVTILPNRRRRSTAQRWRWSCLPSPTTARTCRASRQRSKTMSWSCRSMKMSSATSGRLSFSAGCQVLMTGRTPAAMATSVTATARMRSSLPFSPAKKTASAMSCIGSTNPNISATTTVAASCASPVALRISEDCSDAEETHRRYTTPA